LATYILFVNILGKGHLKNHKNKEILEKYEPFNRIDIENWGIIKCFPMYITFWPRVIIMTANLIFYAIWVYIFMIGVDLQNPKIGPLRYNIIKRMG
jgi:hypothetical protein